MIYIGLIFDNVDGVDVSTSPPFLDLNGFEVPHHLHIFVQNWEARVDNSEVQLYQFCAVTLGRVLDLVNVGTLLVPS